MTKVKKNKMKTHKGTKKVLNIRQSLEKVLHFFHEYRFGDCAYLLVYNLTILEEQNSRNVADTVFGSHIAVIIHIALTDDDLSFKLRGQFFNNRSHHFTRATPGSPKIHHNRLSFCKDFLIVAVCNF